MAPFSSTPITIKNILATPTMSLGVLLLSYYRGAYFSFWSGRSLRAGNSVFFKIMTKLIAEGPDHI